METSAPVDWAHSMLIALTIVLQVAAAQIGQKPTLKPDTGNNEIIKTAAPDPAITKLQVDDLGKQVAQLKKQLDETSTKATRQTDSSAAS